MSTRKPPQVKIFENAKGIISRADFTIPVVETEKNGVYYVSCPILNLSGYSKVSSQVAFEDFEADVRVFFRLHIERNSLKTTLEKFGWKKQYNGKKFVPIRKLPAAVEKNAKAVTNSVTLANVA